ncbi:MAG: hypothetical protein ABIW49_03495 [Knoellia sp.]
MGAKAARMGSFGARHVFALASTVAACCLAWTLAYGALLLWTVVTDGGVGGPLVHPAGLLFTFVAASFVGLALSLPSTVGSEWIARRGGWPVLVQIPLSVVGLALLCLGVVVLGDVPLGFGLLFLALLVPLGIYWWSAQSGPLLLSMVRGRAHRGEA